MKKDKFTMLVHPVTGERRKVKNGWSWTVAFFGVFALLKREQFKVAAIYFGIATAFTLINIFVLRMLLGIYIPSGIHRALVIGLACGFAQSANGLLLDKLMKQGYVVQGEGE